MKSIITKFKLNDEGSSGGLAGLVLNFIFFSLICLILGKVFDVLVRTNNSFIGNFALSGDAVNTMSNLSMIFTALPFIYLIFLIINHIVIANRDSSGDV